MQGLVGGFGLSPDSRAKGLEFKMLTVRVHVPN